ncbi:MAG: hypothetical protein KDK70_05375, partial [Myxococcales bacterium]|nr:hypothetical protein [Myxococcales bacterium]
MRVVGLGLALAALVLAGCTSASSESASLPPQAVQAEPQAPEVAVTDEKPPSAGPGAGPSAGPSGGPGVVAPAAVTVGERSLVPRQGIHGVALWQPAALEELATAGLPSEGAIPALMVLATEHPSVTPPSLTVQDRGGEAVLV